MYILDVFFVEGRKKGGDGSGENAHNDGPSIGNVGIVFLGKGNADEDNTNYYHEAGEDVFFNEGSFHQNGFKKGGEERS